MYSFPRDQGIAIQDRVIVGVAWNHYACRIRSLSNNVLQLSVNPHGFPPHPKRHVQNVHPQIVHHSRLATLRLLPLPIDGLLRIEIAGMPKSGADFDDLAEVALLNRLDHSLDARIEREFRRTPDESAAGPSTKRNVHRRLEINPKRFLREKIFPRRQRIHVDLLVQIVRHGHIDHIYVPVGEKRVIVGSLLSYGGNSVKPLKRRRIQIRHRH